MGGMSKTFVTLLECVAFVAVVAVAAWVRARCQNAPMPAVWEAPHLAASAAWGEELPTAAWPKGAVARQTPFHVLAGEGARFVGEAEPYRTRCYRLFTFALSVLFVACIPVLGLRRRGGVFETADGPLWAMGVAALSAALVWHGCFFGPFSGQAFAFLALLATARAYAQWPGYCAAAAMGAIVALAAAVEPDVLWVVAALTPAVAIGVGWTRLCLYWRTLHMALALAVAVGVGTALAHFGLWGGWPSSPVLPEALGDWVRGPAWRLVWLGAGGIGALAWVGLTAWGGWRPNRRWARVLTVAVPFLLVGSFFFSEGGAFAVPLACLTPILAGLALTTIPKAWVRGALGVAMLLFLAAWTAWWLRTAWAPLPSREQVAEASTLLGAAQDAPARKGVRVRVVSARTDAVGAAECAALLWPLRATAHRVAFGSEPVFDDADIVIVDEAFLDGVPPSVGRSVRAGVVRFGEGRAFRVFAQSPKGAEEAL